MYPDSTKIGQVRVTMPHRSPSSLPRFSATHILTPTTHGSPCPQHTTIPLPHNSHVLTHGTTHNSHALRIKTHQPTTPHVSHMPLHANSNADTSHMASCTWDLQAPLSFVFLSPRCCQVPGEGAAALPRPDEESFSWGALPSPSKPPSSLTVSLISRGPLRAGIKV